MILIKGLALIFKIQNKVFLVLIFILIGLKILFFTLIQSNFILSGFSVNSDADYYNDYALGYLDNAVNLWPIILYKLNSIGLYNRDYITWIFFLINLFLIPFFLCCLANLKFKLNQNIFLYAFFISSLYPTLFFYSLDIYRDVFMVLLFLIACFFVKEFFLQKQGVLKFFLLLLVFLFGCILFKFRAYLGYSFFGALFLYKINFTKKRILIFLFSYILLLFFANYFGLLDSLTNYRSGFEEYSGGSTLGLDFSNPIMFIPNFILSLLGQLLGVYITNPIAIFLFFIETIPFVIMFFYIIKNISLADKFLRFLIIFFVLYASVWLIGNDNLGTAVRLRMFNYFAVYICFFYILRLKTQLRVH